MSARSQADTKSDGEQKPSPTATHSPFSTWNFTEGPNGVFDIHKNRSRFLRTSKNRQLLQDLISAISLMTFKKSFESSCARKASEPTHHTSNQPLHATM